jgi:hypothetical protein
MSARRQQASAQHLREAFAKAMQGDLSAPVTLTQTGAQVLEDELDYRDFKQRALVILANAAAGRGTQRDAQKLLEDMGAHYAWMNAE